MNGPEASFWKSWSKIFILLVILVAFSREDSMFETKMLVLGLQKKALSSRVSMVGYGPASQLDITPSCGLGRASLKETGV